MMDCSHLSPSFDDCDNRVGGDHFPEYDYLHECKNNQSILFLSNDAWSDNSRV